MRFFFNFFDKVKNRANSVFPFEYNKVIEFNNEFSELLKKDAFLARSDYSFLLTKYDDIYVFFNSCKTALTLEFYCKQNKINKKKPKCYTFEQKKLPRQLSGKLLSYIFDTGTERNQIPGGMRETASGKRYLRATSTCS